jgi:hypothetical protein
MLNAAIADQDGSPVLYTVSPDLPGPEWLHQLASFDKRIILKHLADIPNLD